MAGAAFFAARSFTRAAVRYRLFAAAFALTAAVGPFALAAAMLRTAPLADDAGSAAAAAFGLARLALPALLVVGAIAGALLVDLTFDVIRLRRVKHGADLLGWLAVRRARVGTSGTVVSPTAIGYLHPAVVLPAGFRDRVDAGEWDAVLAHECAHLARHDDWAKALQSAVLRAGWWLPGLWLLARGLDLERELASDERAARETGPRRYAACLLRLATDRCGEAVAPTLWGRRSHVAIRVERLLRPAVERGPIVRAAALGAFTASALATVVTAALILPGMAPGRAALATQANRPARTAPHATTTRHLAARLRHALPTAQPRLVSMVAGPAAPVAVDVPPRTEAEATHAAASEESSTTVPASRPLVAPPAAAATAPATRKGAHAPGGSTLVTGAGVLAFTSPHRRCPTCFGPLRSPDDAVPSAPPAFTPPSGVPSGGVSALTTGDPTSGPVDLSQGVVWYRLPTRGTLAP